MAKDYLIYLGRRISLNMVLTSLAQRLNTGVSFEFGYILSNDIGSSVARIVWPSSANNEVLRGK